MQEATSSLNTYVSPKITNSHIHLCDIARKIAGKKTEVQACERS